MRTNLLRSGANNVQTVSPQNGFEISGLTVAYEGKPVLWDVSFKAQTGRITAIVGPNGAGKSTLLKAALGLIPKITGETRVLGTSYRPVEGKVAYMPQRAAVDWSFPASALDVVMMGLYRHLGLFRWPGRAERKRALDCLAMVDMAAFADRQIGQLSGGQQQRVFMARALAQDAKIYLMDEPFAGVDMATETIILKTLKRLAGEGKGVVVVHHDLETVKDMFDDVLLLNKQVIASGAVEDVMDEETIRTTFSGRMDDIVKAPFRGPALMPHG